MSLHWPPLDPPMGVRIKRLRMGLASYFMFLLPLVFAVEQGWVQFGYPGLALFALAGLVANLACWVAIRSGWSRRLRDPALTLPQIALASGLALLMVRFADEARGVLLMLFISSFFFGIFALTTRQMLALAVAILAGYAGLVVLPMARDAPGSEALRLEQLRFLTLAMILVWMSLIGGYVVRLRHKLAQALERLRALASHDELTGVYNRRHLMEILLREKERADRFGHQFALCIVDIDHFKAINDSHGHPVGDEVLRAFAQRMRAHTRRMDWVAREDPRTDPGAFGRFGGEEFLLVLPHATSAGARLCLDRIRQALRLDPIATAAGPIPVRFSAGIAGYRQNEPVDETLARADAALYRAKRAGRDRIEDEGVGGPEPPVGTPAANVVGRGS